MPGDPIPLNQNGRALLLALVNRDNQTSLAPTDVEFGLPSPLTDDPVYNTTVDMASTETSSYIGTVPLKYNRLDLATLFAGREPSYQTSAAFQRSLDLLGLINAEANLALDADDIRDEPLVLSGAWPRVQTLRAAAGSLTYIGEFPVEITAPPSELGLGVYNSYSKSVMWVDPTTYQIKATVPLTLPGNNITGNLHDIKADGGKLYVVYRGGSFYEIDPRAGTYRTIGTGLGDLMGFEVRDGIAYLTSGSDAKLKKVDVATGTVLQEIVTPSKFPTRTAMSPNGQYIYVAGINSPLRPMKIRTSDLVVEATALLNVSTPKGMAVSPDGTRLVIADDNFSTPRVHVFNAANMLLIVSKTVGTGGSGVCYSPLGDFFYSMSFFSGSTYRLRKFRTSDNVEVGFYDFLRANTAPLAISPDGTRVFIGTTGYGSSSSVPDILTVVNTETMTLAAQITVGSDPHGLVMGQW